MKRQARELLRRLARAAEPTQPHLEVIYQQLFVRDLARTAIPDQFYGVGGAANYSLLYLILRIARELGPQNVLDVGAGQTTLLFHQLRKAGLVQSVTTLESEPFWADAIGREVEHPVICAELTSQPIAGFATLTYDWAKVADRAPFDMVICDGPLGVERRSRWGVLSVVPWLASDFVLIMDDAERDGERETCDELRRQLEHRGAAAGRVVAAKKQAIFAAGRYTKAAFF